MREAGCHLSSQADETMKIVLWGTYDTGKPRIRILRDGLRAMGVEVTEIHENIWGGVTDKSALRGAGQWLWLGLRLLMAYPCLIWHYLRAPSHDLVLVSYPGQLDVLVLRPFAWMRHTPVAFDWFISAFDTVVDDRGLLSRHNPFAWALWAGEWLATRAANLVFMDTATHALRMERMFRLRPNSVGCVWVGVEQVFFNPGTRQPCNGHVQVLFYGQFIPLHGIETIIQAAHLLSDAPIRWTLIGRGQESSRIRSLLAEEPVPALQWVEWAHYEDLVKWIARADVCLGIFGTTDKAASVIPNKVFQIISGGAPLVTRDSPAIRELLDENSPCVHLVTPGDPQALANAIRNSIAVARSVSRPCHQTLRGRIDSTAIARQFLSMVEQKFPSSSKDHDR